MKRVILLIIISIFCKVALGQFSRPSEWKKYKHEIFGAVGAANMLGDLGGRDKEGSHYTPADLNFNQSRTAFGIGYRYKVAKLVNLAGKFSYLILKGDDAQTKDIYRRNRNLNFKSNVFELTGRVEVGVQKFKRGGSKYGVQKSSSKSKMFSHAIYGFIGIGGFYYNPKGRRANGEYVQLRPLHTEGQGLSGGPKQYGKFSINIPVGVYYKFIINKQISIGAELGYRKTFTDYIDDVGSVYYDKTALLNAYGPLSVEMSDPNLGKQVGFSSPDASGTPAQRGDKYKDAYLTFELTASYIFKKQRKSARLRSKF